MAALGHTVDPDATGDYLTLSALDAAQEQDLTDGGGDTYLATCISSGGTLDSTVCVIDGWVPGSGNELTIQGDWTSGVYDATKYRLDVNAQWTGALHISDDYVLLKDFQVGNTNGSSSEGDTVRIYGSNCRIERALVHIAARHGIQDRGTDNVIVNTIVYGSEGIGIWKAENGGALYIYNCTSVANGTYGIFAGANRTTTVKNCYCGGNTTADYLEDTNATLAVTTCYSADGSESTPTAAYSISAGAYFINITGGSEDLDIGASSTLRGNGTNLSGDGTYAFNDDVIGTTRSAWDVGAFEYIAPPAEGNIVPIINHYMTMMRNN